MATARALRTDILYVTRLEGCLRRLKTFLARFTRLCHTSKKLYMEYINALWPIVSVRRLILARLYYITDVFILLCHLSFYYDFVIALVPVDSIRFLHVPYFLYK